MPAIAVNIALVFPMTPALVAANAYLSGTCATGFRFDAQHKPHLTLLQDFVSDGPQDMAQLTTALDDTLATYPPPGQVRFCTLSTLPGLSPCLLTETAHDALGTLHREILAATESFHLPVNEAEPPDNAFADTPSLSGFNYTKCYRTKHAAAHYEPHLTLGKGDGAVRQRLLELLPLPMTLYPTEVVLAQLGPHGTVSDNVFARWHIQEPNT